MVKHQNEGNGESRQGTPSTAIRSEPCGEPTRYVALPVNVRKNYAEAVQGVKNKTFKITVKSTGADRPDTIKQILKTKINPGEIKLGIRTFKSFSGGFIIETNSKEEIEILGKEIQGKVWKRTGGTHTLLKETQANNTERARRNFNNKYRRFNP